MIYQIPWKYLSESIEKHAKRVGNSRREKFDSYCTYTLNIRSISVLIGSEFSFIPIYSFLICGSNTSGFLMIMPLDNCVVEIKLWKKGLSNESIGISSYIYYSQLYYLAIIMKA